MEEQAGRSGSGSSGGSGGNGGNNGSDQGSFAEVTVIDSQFQHFSSYIEVIRVFKCRLCTFCSPLEHVIASHMSEVHFPRRCFLCKQCLFVFEDRAQLVSHLDSAHGTKSIAVCFGDTVNGGYSSPPPSMSMMMRTTEGEERIAQQMVEETGVEETSGRVTSSTGNLANLAEGVHCSPIPRDCMVHSGAASRTTPPEGGRASEPPAITIDSRQDQLQSRSSSCHPSSSNQVYSSPDIIDCEAPNLRPEHPEVPNRQQQPPVSLPPNAELRVTIGNTYCQSYIKTEPISPVRSAESHPKPKARPFLSRSRHDPRSYMRRWSLTENSSTEDGGANANSRMSRSFDIPGSGSGLQNGIEEVEVVNSEKDVREEGAQNLSHSNGEVMRESSNDAPENGESSNKVESNKSAEERGRMVEKSKFIDAVRETRTLLGGSKSYEGGRSLDGRPPRLVRQSVVEESPGNSPLPRVMSQENSSSQEKSEGSTLTVPFSGAEMMRRENFSRSFPGTSGKPSIDPHQHQKPSEGNQNFRHTLRDLVSSRIEHGERQQQHQPTAPHTSESNQYPNLAVSNAAATWMRAGRVRSYSISEGDMRGFQATLHPDGTHLKPVEGQMVPGALERDQGTNGHSRFPPGHPQVPPGLHHYPGLVYQPFSIEGEPKHLRYYNQGPRMAGPNAVDGLPHPARVRLEENGQHPSQNQPMEESFLYRFLRNNGSRKHRRNSVSVGSEGPSAALMSPHGAPPRGFVPHPEGVEPIGFDRHRGLPWPPPRHHHPDHPFPQQSPFPSHMPPYQMVWKDKLDASQVSPNTSVNGEQRPGVEYGSLPEREPSGRGDSAGGVNGVVVIDGKVMRAKQAEGGESNQDLAKDITRQVQQVMGGTQPLYNSTDRHLPPWMEGTDRPESPDDPMDGDSLGQRRSRKSTFNIYREIPERKRKLDHDEEEKIKHSYNADGSFDYFSLTGWKAYKCDLCKKRRFKTASELQEHKQRKHGLERSHSSQGSLNGISEGGLNSSMVEINEPNDSPSSG